MDPVVIFLKSLLVGFCVAVPIGPVGVLVIRRSLTHGWRWAFLSGLAAAVADGLYGFIATHGLNSVTRLVTEHKDGLEISGGLLLLFLGWQMFSHTNDTANKPLKKNETLLQDAFYVFFLMIASPVTILIFLALLATVGVRNTHHQATELIVAGIMSGSTLWWLLLSTGAHAFKQTLTPTALKKIDHVAGTLVTLFGLVKLAQGLFIH